MTALAQRDLFVAPDDPAPQPAPAPKLPKLHGNAGPVRARQAPLDVAAAEAYADALRTGWARRRGGGPLTPDDLWRAIRSDRALWLSVKHHGVSLAMARDPDVWKDYQQGADPRPERRDRAAVRTCGECGTRLQRRRKLRVGPDNVGRCVPCDVRRRRSQPPERPGAWRTKASGKLADLDVAAAYAEDLNRGARNIL